MLAAGAAHAGGAAERGHRAPSPHARYYVVRPGDTLWAIAARATSPNADLRPVVDRLVAVNRLDGSLVPGQRIAVPR